MPSMLIWRMLRDFFDGLWGFKCVGRRVPGGEGGDRRRGGSRRRTLYRRLSYRQSHMARKHGALGKRRGAV